MYIVNELAHYGTPRHSGRYPWGSGDDPYQRSSSFMKEVKRLKDEGLSEKEIAEGFGMNSTEFRARRSIAKDEMRQMKATQALKLKDKGYSNVEIGRRMGINESSVRSLLNPVLAQRANATRSIAELLKKNVEEKDYIDIGSGVENYLGVSRTKLKTALLLLKEEGYTVHYTNVEQLGTGKNTSVMVLAKPGVTGSEIYKNKDQISMVVGKVDESGRTKLGLDPITNIDSSRIHIKYYEDGGVDKDGVLELRRGVPELSLGSARYAQVRVGVDGTHYMKGMAIYSDDMPPGKDVIYNTNKHRGTSPDKVFKSMKEDPDNPFGASVIQKKYKDKDGKMKTSALNIVNEEGDWGEWSKSLSSQFLSKQSPQLAKKQLDLAYKIKKEEFDEIMSLTNPTIKKRLLDAFGDDCDSSAVHLKAAALPRQATHVLLPFPKMKDNEIFAPNYRDGEKVVLVRYPHGGIFEIPELTVNNRYKAARDLLTDEHGSAKDAVGIHPKVAERLSGADFDGDTVLVIPNNNKAIRSSAPLAGLKDFEPKEYYAGFNGMKTIDGGVLNVKTGKVDYGDKGPNHKTMQHKMGDVSNLITDMTIKKAESEEIARAVRHSMVVIDSEKHHLNYKQSYIDNGIGSLKKKYQGRVNAGASTLVSKASSPQAVNFRVEGEKRIIDPKTGKTKRFYINPDTGEKLYDYSNGTYSKYTTKDPLTGKSKRVYPKEIEDATGKKKTVFIDSQTKEEVNTPIKEKVIQKKIQSTKMYEAKDAHELSSGTAMETIYADYANKLKALANTTRKETLSIKAKPYSPSAKKAYETEVESLKAQLKIAEMNAPLERKAQLLANSIVRTKQQDNPHMSGEDLKKIKGQALAEARVRTGASKQRIDIKPREWEAIQAGAISNNALTKILNNTDLDKVKTLATPRTKLKLTPAKEARAKLMIKKGYTRSEIADALGIPTSAVSDLEE